MQCSDIAGQQQSDPRSQIIAGIDKRILVVAFVIASPVALMAAVEARQPRPDPTALFW